MIFAFAIHEHLIEFPFKIVIIIVKIYQNIEQ